MKLNWEKTAGIAFNNRGRRKATPGMSSFQRRRGILSGQSPLIAATHRDRDPPCGR